MNRDLGRGLERFWFSQCCPSPYAPAPSQAACNQASIKAFHQHDALLIIGVQSLLSFIAFGLIARWYLVPWLSKFPLEDRLLALTWLHVFRYVALTGLLPGQVSADVPAFALNAVVYGDTISALLALVSVILLRARAPGAIAMAWVFNVVGLLDWAQSQVVGVSAQAFAYPAGVSALVYAFYVPLLVVTHVVMFYWLFSHRRSA